MSVGGLVRLCAVATFCVKQLRELQHGGQKTRACVAAGQTGFVQSELASDILGLRLDQQWKGLNTER